MATMAAYPVRPYRLGIDTEAVGALEDAAFTEDYRRMGEDPSAERHRAKRVESLLALLAKLIPSLRYAEMGHVIEREGRIASAVFYSREGTKGNQWTIDAVGTHPDFQGMGMARQLVSKTLESIRAHGGKICTLKVREDNDAAYRLYRSLGFEHYDTTHHLKRSEKTVLRSAGSQASPEGLEEVSVNDWFDSWKQRLGLAHRATRQEVRQFVPIQATRFKRPWIIRVLAPLAMKIGGFSVKQWFVRRDGKLIATLRIRADRTGSRSHEIKLELDPAYSDLLAGELIDLALGELALFQPGNTLIEVRGSDPVLRESLSERDFRPMSVWHWLGTRLESA